MPRVDHLHAGVAGGDGDLLGAVGVAVEAGLGDQELRRAAGDRAHVLGHLGELAGPPADGGADPGRGAVLAEHRAQLGGPLAGRAAGRGQRDRRRHDVRAVARRPGAAPSSALATASSSRAARHAATSAISSASTAGSTVRMLPAPAERRRLGLGEPVDADDDLLAGLDAPGALRPSSAPAGPSARRRPRTPRRARARPPARPTPRRAAPRSPPRSRVEPSKMSSYSSRSLSNASTCCIRNDHC